MANDDDRGAPDEIDLSLDDLDEEPLPPVAAPPASGDMLVITGDDLLDISDTPAPAPAAGGYPAAPPAAGGYSAAYPGVDGAVPPPGMMSKKGMFSGGLVGSLLIQMFIAGAIGGFLAWAINEPFTSDAASVMTPEQAPPSSLWLRVGVGFVLGLLLGGALGRYLGRSDLRGRIEPGAVAIGAVAGALIGALGGGVSANPVFSSSMIFFTIVGGAIGLFLGGVEGASSFNIEKALIGGLIGLAIGAVGGGLAGLLGQSAYGILRGSGDRLTLLQIFARIVGWTIAGIFIGLGQGVSGRSPKKMLNGVIGGAIGGFVGGMLFDPIGAIMAHMTDSPGLISRLIAIVVIGAASGAAIGLIEELRKEAWLLITGGPLTGKQFILYNAVTTIGSSPKCDIALLKDPYIAPQHCVIELAAGGYALRDLGTQTGTAVNGRPVQRHQLRSGDVIQIGQTALEYQDRALR